MSRPPGAQAGETLWALTDHLGSAGDLVDNSGQLRLHRQFDAFGNISAEIHSNAAGQHKIDSPNRLTKAGEILVS